MCLHRVWLTWAKAHWHSVPTIATGSWWVRSPSLDCSLSLSPSSTSRTVSCCFFSPPAHCASALCCRTHLKWSISLFDMNTVLLRVYYSHPRKIALHSLWPGSSHAATYAGHLRWGATTAGRVCQSWTGEEIIIHCKLCIIKEIALLVFQRSKECFCLLQNTHALWFDERWDIQAPVS